MLVHRRFRGSKYFWNVRILLPEYTRQQPEDSHLNVFMYAIKYVFLPELLLHDSQSLCAGTKHKFLCYGQLQAPSPVWNEWRMTHNKERAFACRRGVAAHTYCVRRERNFVSTLSIMQLSWNTCGQNTARTKFTADQNSFIWVRHKLNKLYTHQDFRLRFTIFLNNKETCIISN
jgi:hypothetical protein